MVRDRNIVIKSQFNINGSRGRDAGKFVSDYVSRSDATNPSMAYQNPVDDGDGVAFSLDATALSRRATLATAQTIQDFHQSGGRAIQQMVISFDHDYLLRKGLIDPTVAIREKGDYANNYDDVRLRHAVIKGLQNLVDKEGYRDGRAIAAIQHDTLHLHVHAVVYENHPSTARKRGFVEKGVIKESSFEALTQEIDRFLDLTRVPVIPTQRVLTPTLNTDRTVTYDVGETPPLPDMSHIDIFIRLIKEQKEAEELAATLNTFLSDITYDPTLEDSL